MSADDVVWLVLMAGGALAALLAWLYGAGKGDW